MSNHSVPIQSHGVYVVFETQLHQSKLRRSAVRVEEFQFETSLDNDSDTFTISIGTPKFGLSDIVSERDEELKITLYLQPPLSQGGSGGNLVKLFSGFVDAAVLTDDGKLQLQGRDISALATDSQPIPNVFTNLRPSVKFAKEALDLGFPAAKLVDTPVIPKFFRDGNETYWENWYRAVRKFKYLWLWTEPDGTLVSDLLSYEQNPSYFIGVAPLTTKDKDFSKPWINALSVEFSKNTATRVGEVLLYYNSGNQVHSLPIQKDWTIDHWIKKPRRVIVDSKSTSEQGAKKVALEEITEGRVSSQEITISVPYTGTLYKQNKMCRLNIPFMDIGGTFFIVGVTFIGNGSGFVQQLRLREKGYALSLRKPDDPVVLGSASANQGTPYDTGVSFIVPNAEYNGYNMGPWFVRAAQAWHNSIDFDLFLATIVAIAYHETAGTYRNLMNNGVDAAGIEYYPPPSPTSVGSFGSILDKIPGIPSESLSEWHRKFQNENPVHAVGPMQLYTNAYKLWAEDDYAKRNGRKPQYDQYLDGRWRPESNIWAGARGLDSHIPLTGPGGADGRLRSGIHGYAGSGPLGQQYMEEIWTIIHKAPGTLKMVQSYETEVHKAAAEIRHEIADSQKDKSHGLGFGERLTGPALNKKILSLIDSGKMKISSSNAPAARSDIEHLGTLDQNLLQLIYQTYLRGYTIWISALKSDHTIDVFNHGVDTGRPSDHGFGRAFDNNYYSVADSRVTDSQAAEVQQWLYDNRAQLYIKQIIGPNNALCYAGPQSYDPSGGGTLQGTSTISPFDPSTLEAHNNHIHCSVYPSGK